MIYNGLEIEAVSCGEDVYEGIELQQLIEDKTRGIGEQILHLTQLESFKQIPFTNDYTLIVSDLKASVLQDKEVVNLTESTEGKTNQECRELVKRVKEFDYILEETEPKSKGLKGYSYTAEDISNPSLRHVDRSSLKRPKYEVNSSNLDWVAGLKPTPPPLPPRDPEEPKGPPFGVVLRKVNIGRHREIGDHSLEFTLEKREQLAKVDKVKALLEKAQSDVETKQKSVRRIQAEIKTLDAIIARLESETPDEFNTRSQDKRKTFKQNDRTRLSTDLEKAENDLIDAQAKAASALRDLNEAAQERTKLKRD